MRVMRDISPYHKGDQGIVQHVRVVDDGEDRRPLRYVAFREKTARVRDRWLHEVWTDFSCSNTAQVNIPTKSNSTQTKALQTQSTTSTQTCWEGIVPSDIWQGKDTATKIQRPCEWHLARVE